MHAEILRLSDLTDRDLGAWDALAAHHRHGALDLANGLTPDLLRTESILRAESSWIDLPRPTALDLFDRGTRDVVQRVRQR